MINDYTAKDMKNLADAYHKNKVSIEYQKILSTIYEASIQGDYRIQISVTDDTIKNLLINKGFKVYARAIHW